MSEHEQQSVKTIVQAFDALPEYKKEFLLGFAEGVNAMAPAKVDKPDDAPPWD